MSGFLPLRRLVTCSVLAAAVAGGGLLFAQTKPAPTPAQLNATPPAPLTSGSLATVNGHDVSAAFFYDTLMQIDGMRLFEKVRDLALIQTECQTNGIAVEGDDFQKRFKDEFNRAYDSLGANVSLPAGQTLDDSVKMQVMNQVLAKNNVNPIEYKLTLETRTGLRALAKGKTDVTPDDVKDEYDAEYGEKRHVRVFPVGDDLALQDKIRNAIEKNHRTADQAADDLKIPHPGTGIVPSNAKGAETFVKLVFHTLKVEGELSAATDLPVQANQPRAKGMVYLEKIDPDTRAANPETDKLKDQIRQKVYDAKEELWMNNHLILARANAAVTINDPILSSMYEKLAEQYKAQAAAVATQPGGAAITPASGAASAGGSSEPSLPPIPGKMPPAATPNK